jgi:phage terminase large subunit
MVCIRETMLSLKQSSKRLIEDKIQAHGVGRLFKVLEDRIKTPGRWFDHSSPVCRPIMRSLSKAWKGYDVAWVEEAQTLSQWSLDLLLPTIRKPGSKLWFKDPRTPPNENNGRSFGDPVDVMFRGGEPPPNSIIVNVNFYDNPWPSDESRSR